MAPVSHRHQMQSRLGALRAIGVALALAATVLVGTTGCEGDSAILALDVKTDFVPGAEFTRVRTLVLGAGSTDMVIETAVANGDDYIEGRRVAELTGLSAGTVRLRVELVDAGGRIVAERPVAVTYEGRNLGAIVVMTRDCRGIECPDPGGDANATACLAGRCVDPECTETFPGACGFTNCAAGGDCPASPTGCAAPLCTGGVCLYEASHDMCEAEQWCIPGIGCRSIADFVDGGLDGGIPDGAFDASFDTAFDTAFDEDAGPCPTGCDSCEAGGCIINGSAGEEVVCPDDIPCVVVCMNDDACTSVTCGNGPCVVSCIGMGSCGGGVDCSPSRDCDVTCLGAGSCGQGTCNGGECAFECEGVGTCAGEMRCLNTSACAIDCIGDDSCNGPLICDGGACNITCEGEATCGAVDCAAACACEVMCTATGGCPTPACKVGCEEVPDECTPFGAGCDTCP